MRLACTLGVNCFSSSYTMAVRTKSTRRSGAYADVAPGSHPIVRIAPGSEGVSIWSPALFADPSGPNSRQFLTRAFSVQEVASVEIRKADAFGRIHYQSTAEAPGIWRKLSHNLCFRGSSLCSKDVTACNNDNSAWKDGLTL